MIRLENIGMRYGSGSEVLRDVSLHLPKGSFHYLCGTSGAGKSSLLKLVYLAAKPTRGRILLDGEDIDSIASRYLPAVRRHIGVVYQDYRLIDSLSAFDNVALLLRLQNIDEKTVKQSVNEMLEWVGLKMHIHAFPRQLSGGQQQRVAVARAVINQPRILVADEPTGNIDDEGAWRLMSLFEEMHHLGTTVLMATHHEKLMKKFSHPILYLEKGHLVESEHKINLSKPFSGWAEK